ncbi:Uncharacterised protein [Mycobacteroides abscessus subsp. abscessus]|nr:Uncharacterised protein [Mycobacteroides abscessus subsp. abscessus]
MGESARESVGHVAAELGRLASLSAHPADEVGVVAAASFVCGFLVFAIGLRCITDGA